MWLKLATILPAETAIGPAVALHFDEVLRWRPKIGRTGGWLAMHHDSACQRAARRSGRAHLGILVLLWFLFGAVVFFSLLDAL